MQLVHDHTPYTLLVKVEEYFHEVLTLRIFSPNPTFTPQKMPRHERILGHYICACGLGASALMLAGACLFGLV